MKHPKWTTSDIPDQRGRVVIVTGASSGIGKQAARVLAQKNALVTLAVRNLAKGEAVADEIRRKNPLANVVVRELDLTSLRSVNAFAQSFLGDSDRLDLLINNAGIMMCPYSTTQDGFEIQMGTNHLGHFALVGHLLERLKRTSGSRVVVLSSLAHRNGKIDFSDVHWEKRTYKTSQAYCDSKLANLHFADELSRRFADENAPPLVTAAHPGWTRTDLQRHLRIMDFLNPLFAQGIEAGVLPTLRAAVDPDAKRGDYFGPSGFFEMHGSPVRVQRAPRAYDPDAAKRLWALSEEMTGMSY